MPEETHLTDTLFFLEVMGFFCLFVLNTVRKSYMNKAKTEKAQTAPTEVEMTQALRVEALSYNHPPLWGQWLGAALSRHVCNMERWRNGSRSTRSHLLSQNVNELDGQRDDSSSDSRSRWKTHVNGFPALSVKEDFCESRNTEKKEHKYKHIHWQRADKAEGREHREKKKTLTT